MEYFPTCCSRGDMLMTVEKPPVATFVHGNIRDMVDIFDGLNPRREVSTVGFILQQKRQWFPRLRRPFWVMGRLPLCLSCSAPFRSKISSPPSPSFSFPRGRRTCHGGIFLFLCLAACPPRTQTETWVPCMTRVFVFLCTFTMSNLRRSSRISDASYRPRTTWSLPEIVSVACICFFQETSTLTRIFGKQGVAPSSREARRHVHEAEEDHMHVDDVGPTGSGTFLISLPYEADYLCCSFLFFSAGQPLVVDPVPLPTENSGGTHGKSKPVIYKAPHFFDIFKKNCSATAYRRFRIIDRK